MAENKQLENRPFKVRANTYLHRLFVITRIQVTDSSMLIAFTVQGYTANPGHSASAISPGTFEAGTYEFPTGSTIGVGGTAHYPMHTNGSLCAYNSTDHNIFRVNASTNTLLINSTTKIGGRNIVESQRTIFETTDSGTYGATKISYINGAMTFTDELYGGYRTHIRVVGTTDTYFGLTSGQKIGIGTPSPTTNLHINDTLRLEPRESPPACSSSAQEGTMHSDTSGALCFCTASSWSKVAGAGTCA